MQILEKKRKEGRAREIERREEREKIEEKGKRK